MFTPSPKPRRPSRHRSNPNSKSKSNSYSSPRNTSNNNKRRPSSRQTSWPSSPNVDLTTTADKDIIPRPVFNSLLGSAGSGRSPFSSSPWSSVATPGSAIKDRNSDRDGNKSRKDGSDDVFVDDDEDLQLGSTEEDRQRRMIDYGNDYREEVGGGDKFSEKERLEALVWRDPQRFGTAWNAEGTSRSRNNSRRRGGEGGGFLSLSSSVANDGQVKRKKRKRKDIGREGEVFDNDDGDDVVDADADEGEEGNESSEGFWDVDKNKAKMRRGNEADEDEEEDRKKKRKIRKLEKGNLMMQSRGGGNVANVGLLRSGNGTGMRKGKGKGKGSLIVRDWEPGSMIPQEVPILPGLSSWTPPGYYSTPHHSSPSFSFSFSSSSSSSPSHSHSPITTTTTTTTTTTHHYVPSPLATTTPITALATLPSSRSGAAASGDRKRKGREVSPPLEEGRNADYDYDGHEDEMEDVEEEEKGGEIDEDDAEKRLRKLMGIDRSRIKRLRRFSPSPISPSPPLDNPRPSSSLGSFFSTPFKFPFGLESWTPFNFFRRNQDSEDDGVGVGDGDGDGDEDEDEDMDEVRLEHGDDDDDDEEEEEEEVGSSNKDCKTVEEQVDEGQQGEEDSEESSSDEVQQQLSPHRYHQTPSTSTLTPLQNNNIIISITPPPATSSKLIQSPQTPNSQELIDPPIGSKSRKSRVSFSPSTLEALDRKEKEEKLQIEESQRFFDRLMMDAQELEEREEESNYPLDVDVGEQRKEAEEDRERPDIPPRPSSRLEIREADGDNADADSLSSDDGGSFSGDVDKRERVPRSSKRKMPPKLSQNDKGKGKSRTHSPSSSPAESEEEVVENPSPRRRKQADSDQNLGSDSKSNSGSDSDSSSDIYIPPKFSPSPRDAQPSKSILKNKMERSPLHLTPDDKSSEEVEMSDDDTREGGKEDEDELTFFGVGGKRLSVSMIVDRPVFEDSDEEGGEEERAKMNNREKTFEDQEPNDVGLVDGGGHDIEMKAAGSSASIPRESVKDKESDSDAIKGAAERVDRGAVDEATAKVEQQHQCPSSMDITTSTPALEPTGTTDSAQNAIESIPDISFPRSFTDSNTESDVDLPDVFTSESSKEKGKGKAVIYEPMEEWWKTTESHLEQEHLAGKTYNPKLGYQFPFLSPIKLRKVKDVYIAMVIEEDYNDGKKLKGKTKEERHKRDYFLKWLDGTIQSNKAEEQAERDKRWKVWSDMPYEKRSRAPFKQENDIDLEQIHPPIPELPEEVIERLLDQGLMLLGNNGSIPVKMRDCHKYFRRMGLVKKTWRRPAQRRIAKCTKMETRRNVIRHLFSHKQLAEQNISPMRTENLSVASFFFDDPVLPKNGSKGPTTFGGLPTIDDIISLISIDPPLNGLSLIHCQGDLSEQNNKKKENQPRNVILPPLPTTSNGKEIIRIHRISRPLTEKIVTKLRHLTSFTYSVGRLSSGDSQDKLPYEFHPVLGDLVKVVLELGCLERLCLTNLKSQGYADFEVSWDENPIVENKIETEWGGIYTKPEWKWWDMKSDFWKDGGGSSFSVEKRKRETRLKSLTLQGTEILACELDFLLTLGTDEGSQLPSTSNMDIDNLDSPSICRGITHLQTSEVATDSRIQLLRSFKKVVPNLESLDLGIMGYSFGGDMKEFEWSLDDDDGGGSEKDQETKSRKGIDGKKGIDTANGTTNEYVLSWVGLSSADGTRKIKKLSLLNMQRFRLGVFEKVAQNLRKPLNGGGDETRLQELSIRFGEQIEQSPLGDENRGEAFWSPPNDLTPLPPVPSPELILDTTLQHPHQLCHVLRLLKPRKLITYWLDSDLAYSSPIDTSSPYKPHLRHQHEERLNRIKKERARKMAWDTRWFLQRTAEEVEKDLKRGVQGRYDSDESAGEQQRGDELEVKVEVFPWSRNRGRVKTLNHMDIDGWVLPEEFLR